MASRSSSGRWCFKDHHEGYVDWAEFERHQKRFAVIAHGRSGGVKSGRGDRALLMGMLRCAHCGRRLTVACRGRLPALAVYRYCSLGNHAAVPLGAAGAPTKPWRANSCVPSSRWP